MGYLVAVSYAFNNLAPSINRERLENNWPHQLCSRFSLWLYCPSQTLPLRMLFAQPFFSSSSSGCMFSNFLFFWWLVGSLVSFLFFLLLLPFLPLCLKRVSWTSNGTFCLNTFFLHLFSTSRLCWLHIYLYRERGGERFSSCLLFVLHNFPTPTHSLSLALSYTQGDSGETATRKKRNTCLFVCLIFSVLFVIVCGVAFVLSCCVMGSFARACACMFSRCAVCVNVCVCVVRVSANGNRTGTANPRCSDRGKESKASFKTLYHIHLLTCLILWLGSSLSLFRLNSSLSTSIPRVDAWRLFT